MESKIFSSKSESQRQIISRTDLAGALRRGDQSLSLTVTGAVLKLLLLTVLSTFFGAGQCEACLAVQGSGETRQAAKPNAVPKADPARLASAVKVIFRNRCAECHGQERKEADLDVLAWDSYVAEDGSVIPEDADGSYLFERIATDDEDYRMPELPHEALSQAEIETVRKWIESGAQKFPEDVAQPVEQKEDEGLAGVVGTEYVLTQIVQFIEKQPREERPYFRFFSSNHSLTAGATKDELKTQHQALAKAINHLSMEPVIVRPTVVDEGLGTIFAIDIRKVGWHARPFVTKQGQASNVDLFDLALLEYPYSIVFPDSTNFEKLWDLFIARADMVRPIPYVRIDWFVSTATQFPLYEDILGIPDNLEELEAILGVDSERNMRDRVAKRAGMTVSGVSQSNRVVERHPSRFGSYWKSYDFETSRGRQNMFIDPIHFDFAGGEMVFNLPNGLQGYLITDTVGKRINAAPTSIVTDKFAADKTVRNGLACMRCHDKGIKRFVDNIRPAIEKLPGGSMLNKKDILRLYPTKEEMDQLLDRDEKKFLSAMEEVLGETHHRDPLTEVSRHFLDNALALKKASSELGLENTGSLKAVFALPQFTRIGLASLTQGGVVRRDTWEDYYDRVIRQLGIGIPVAPVDGLIREDHLANGRSELLIFRTSRRNNIFSPGEKVTIFVENKTGVDLFVEIIGTSVGGRINEVSSGVVPLPSGRSIQLPSEAGYTVQPKLGTEKVTLFASPVRFDAGVLLTSKDDSTHVADRFVHQWYQYDPSFDQPLQNTVPELIKKTIKIETK